MVNAAGTFARPQPGATPSAADAQSDARISSAGKLRGATSAVLDAAAQLNKAQTWQATKASSDNEALVHAISDKASPGDYAINVESMATAQSTASTSFSSLSTVVGIGTLNLEMGSWNSSMSTFATNPNWPKASVTFGPKDTSLEHIRDKINAAGVGVIAMVVQDATGSRLVLRSTGTGEANGFKAEASAPEGQPQHDASAEAAQTLASMGFNPASVSGGAELMQPAKDAKLSIDGRAVQSPQNLIDDEASGLTLRLNGESGKATVRVETDTQSMAHDVRNFVHAYNDMVGQLKEAAPDATDGGAQAARAIQQRMQQAFTEGPSGNQPPMARKLASAGIGMQADGRLSLNEATLNEALAQSPERVERLFDAPAESGQSSGLAARLLDLAAPQDNAAQQPRLTNEPSSASAQGNGSMVATLYRQRLLEQQYAASAMHEDESAMSANEA